MQKILGIGGSEVWRDMNSLLPGDNWGCKISENIEKADIVVVFWSRRAALSEWVRREYRRGIELGKRIIPVLLDDFSLPSDLAIFQAIPCGSFIRARHAEHWRIAYGYVLTALVAILGVLLIGGVACLLIFAVNGYTASIPWHEIGVGVGAGVLGSLALIFFYKRRSFTGSKEASRHPDMLDEASPMASPPPQRTSAARPMAWNPPPTARASPPPARPAAIAPRQGAKTDQKLAIFELELRMKFRTLVNG